MARFRPCFARGHEVGNDAQREAGVEGGKSGFRLEGVVVAKRMTQWTG